MPRGGQPLSVANVHQRAFMDNQPTILRLIFRKLRNSVLKSLIENQPPISISREEAKVREDIWLIAKYIGGFIATGLIALFILEWRAEKGVPFVAILWAAACLACGAIIGFLFGIPRFLQGDNAPPVRENQGNPNARAQKSSHYIPNTNLEQISDWLTKILVGLGLMNLQKFPGLLSQWSQFIAYSLGRPESKFVAGAIILYFSIIGFLGCYLITRLFIAGVLAQTDKDMLNAFSVLPITPAESGSLAASEVGPDIGAPRLSSKAREAAKQIVNVPMEQITTAQELAIWAKAQITVGQYEKAVAGYEKALKLEPMNIKIRVEYATALFYAEHNVEKILPQLLEAYQQAKARSDTNKVTRKDIYRGLTYYYLYVEPDGYKKAIEYGEEYVKKTDAMKAPSGAIWVNLACAYGQKYKHQLADQASAEALAQTRKEALHAIQMALSIDASWQVRLSTLLQKGVLKEESEDDLEVFEEDNEFRQILGLPVRASESESR